MRRSRRAFLRAAALAGSVGLAGCGDGQTTRVTAPPGDDNGNGGTTTSPPNGTGNGTAPNGTDVTDTPTDTPVPIGSSETWRTFQSDAANSGSVELNHTRFVSSEVNWSLQLDGRPTQQPAFDEERLYVPSRNGLTVVDRDTGSELWTYKPPEEKVTTPLVPGDGFVYIVSPSGVYRHHAEEGWQAFAFEFTSEFPNLLGVIGPSPPSFVGNSVIFNVVVKSSGGDQTTVSRLVSLDTDGNRQWTTDKPATTPALGLAPTPAVAGGTMFVTSGRDKQDATLYGMNPGNGGTKFSTGYTGKGWSSVTVALDRLFFADRFADVFTTGGNKVVRRTLNPPPNSYACAAGSEFVFMSSRDYGGNTGRLFAIDPAGRSKWTFEGEGNLFVPTTTDETVYVTSASGSLFAIDQATGLVRWRQDLGLSGQVVASAPVVSTNEIYLTAAPGTDPATLFAISPTS